MIPGLFPQCLVFLSSLHSVFSLFCWERTFLAHSILCFTSIFYVYRYFSLYIVIFSNIILLKILSHPGIWDSLPSTILIILRLLVFFVFQISWLFCFRDILALTFSFTDVPVSIFVCLRFSPTSFYLIGDTCICCSVSFFRFSICSLPSVRIFILASISTFISWTALLTSLVNCSFCYYFKRFICFLCKALYLSHYVFLFLFKRFIPFLFNSLYHFHKTGFKGTVVQLC